VCVGVCGDVPKFCVSVSKLNAAHGAARLENSARSATWGRVGVSVTDKTFGWRTEPRYSSWRGYSLADLQRIK
jgi:hypothetical protein